MLGIILLAGCNRNAARLSALEARSVETTINLAAVEGELMLATNRLYHVEQLRQLEDEAMASQNRIDAGLFHLVNVGWTNELILRARVDAIEARLEKAQGLGRR